MDAIIPYGVDWDALEALQWQNLLNVLDPWTELYPNVEVTLFVETEEPARLSCTTWRIHNSWWSAVEAAMPWRVHCLAPPASTCSITAPCR